MNFFLQWIYLLNFGLYYPFKVFSKSLDVLGDWILSKVLKCFSSYNSRRDRINGYRKAKTIFNQDYDDWRWFTLIDFLVVFNTSVVSLGVTGSGVVMFVMASVAFGFVFYLFDYKDKRKKQFAKIRLESRKKKIVWTVLSYFLLCVPFCLCVKYEHFFLSLFSFLH